MTIQHRSLQRGRRRTPIYGMYLPCSLLFLLVAVAGCGTRGPVGTVSVTGMILAEGKPAFANGSVGFTAVQQGMGGGVARIGAGGRFQMHLRPGEYRVMMIDADAGNPALGKLQPPPPQKDIVVTVDAKHRHFDIDMTP